MILNSSNNKKIRVAIVDDSALIRQILKSIISAQPDMEVCGEAEDPLAARSMIKETNPDVITLDIEMPKMNGIEFLHKIMTLRPMPVIMVSSLTTKNADVTIQALEMGALDYVTKPANQSDVTNITKAFESDLLPKLRAIEGIQPGTIHTLHNAKESPQSHKTEAAKYAGNDLHAKMIAIASSTGGVERLRYLFSNLNTEIPPTLVVQHINHVYLSNLAARMDSCSPPHIKVKVGETKEILKPNTIYFANNKEHMRVKSTGSHLQLQMFEGDPLNGFIASADYLFHSAASALGKECLGIIISGMGCDGAKGIKALKETGATTLGESEKSCLVYGMPKAAAELDALTKEISIKEILGFINYRVKQK
jgi:two-component system chemotaxis response regulator CheB